MKVNQMMNWMLLGVITVCLITLFADQNTASAAEDKADKKHKHTNHLVNESSPYLLQHVHNPVNWYPWGEEAFAKAKKEDKPIFLSVGYSTCHWCHVMERESFEREDVAAILNKHYICIKVDREERPDVDAQYMLATQIFTRRGGWPNSVWLTPDGRPWFAGTYFPREDEGGRPGFKTIMTRLHEVWTNQRDDVEKQANAIAQEIRNYSAGKHFDPVDEITDGMLAKHALELTTRWDRTHGGFGNAPKFPPHSSLSILIRQQQQTPSDINTQVIKSTLDAMMHGGVHDHLIGGFHRYSTDKEWLLPHFEKMLYDNAQLMRLYTDGYLITKDENYLETIENIYTWIKAEMTHKKGGLFSAIDADSEGEEGKFYVWSLKEIETILGKTDAALFAKAYTILPAGNFAEEATGKQTGTNILHHKIALEDLAKTEKLSLKALKDKLATMRQKVLKVRNTRIRPHLDDKILTSWNGLMIEGLAYAGKQLKNQKYIDMAKNAADFILADMRNSTGHLYRTWRNGKNKLPGYLEDYAFFADGLLELHRSTNDKKYLNAAEQLANIMIDDFYDKDEGGFYYASAKHDELISRVKNTGGGGNIPDANAIAVRVLLQLHAIKPNKQFLDVIQQTLLTYGGQMQQSPSSSEDLILAAEDYFKLTKTKSLKVKKSTATTADATTGKKPVQIAVYASKNQVKPGETIYVAFDVTIAPTWHVYAPNNGSDLYIPFDIQLEKNTPSAMGKVRYPTPIDYNDKATEKTLKVFDGRFIAWVPVTIGDNAKGELKLSFKIQSQACDDSRCLMKEIFPAEIKLNIADTAGPDRHQNIFKLLNLKQEVPETP